MRLPIRYTFILILLLSYAPIGYAQKVLSASYKPSKNLKTIAEVLADISSKYKTEISFSEQFLEPSKPVSISDDKHTVGDILTELLAATNLRPVEREDKILLVPITAGANKEPRFTLNGFLKDQISGEVIINAFVTVQGLQEQTTTNQYGFYSLSLPEGYYRIVLQSVGYTSDSLAIYLEASQRRDFLLENKTTLPEINITREKERDVKKGSVQSFQQEDLQRAVFPLGEADVLRRLQQVPGVTVGLDGSTGIRVRGGDPGQNLNLLDGVPVYYIDHLYGVSSVYNTEAIKTVDFYKDAFPARYGGRLASIIDVSTKDGDMQQLKGQASLGLLKGTINLEGPIIKDKSSFFISARRTWADIFLPLFTPDVNLYFYDVNAKLNYIVNPNNRLYLSMYNGRDNVREQRPDGNSSAYWGNSIASLKWTSIINPKLFAKTSLSYSRFKYELQDRNEVITGGVLEGAGQYTGTSTINDVSIRSGLEYLISSNHKVETGLQYTKAAFVPTKIISDVQGIAPEENNFRVNEISFYVEDQWSHKKIFDLSVGVHLSRWLNASVNYNSVQPRFSFAYNPYFNQKLYFSASYMTQFLHLISNNTYGLPTDFWVPSTERIKPERGVQGSLGYSGYKKGYFYTMEAYYKSLEGVTIYTTGKDIFDNSTRWQDKVLQGRGWSYGLEMSLLKNIKALQLSGSYTLAWNWRQFAELNEGVAFPHRYDRRHNLHLSAQYQRNKRFNALLSFTYLSGEAFTMPDQIYPDFDRNIFINPAVSTSSSDYTYQFTRWNNFRLPAIHHLDVAFQFWKQLTPRISRQISAGISNLYGRPNVWYARLENDPSAKKLRLNGYSYTRFLPFLTYKLSF